MSVRETEIIALGAGETPVSSVSWAAVIAGALAAVSISLILMLVGSGLGLAVVSPWSGAGATATTVAISGVVWLVVVQWLSSATGGYMAGRLRKRWTDISGDEVTFRDTAHGFLAWALATIIVAGLLTSAVSAITGTAVQTVATVGAGAVQGAAQAATGGIGDPTAYFVDTLFRKPASSPTAAAAPASTDAAQTASPVSTAAGEATAASSTGSAGSVATAGQAGGDVRAEAGRILVAGLAENEIPAADKAYLGQLVATETGLAPADAEQRVNDVLTQVDAAKAKAKEAADKARKASATLAILMALALVIGAFIASVAAALGGSQRDAI
ncbi:MAG: hypothetical protein ABI399_12605 [Bauldia sp.]